MSGPINENLRIVFLDYLRIFAFTSVLVGHKFYDYLIGWIQDQQAPTLLQIAAAMLLPLVNGGAVGVVVFFLVSGYVVAHVLQSEAPRAFIFKRIFRIYPLYLLAVVTQSLLNASVSGDTIDPHVLIPQMLLIGDLFATPYALNGVEWTLRIEVLFYVGMAGLRSINLLHERRRWLPWILLGSILVLGLAPPVPSARIWSQAYLNIYAPFLLVGVSIYLFEKAKISKLLAFAIVALALLQSYRLLLVYHPHWVATHPTLLGLLVFVFFWAVRGRLVATAILLWVSGLTYAVYLFHNWLFDYFKEALARLAIPVINIDIQALVALILFCGALVSIVEKPAIRLGRALQLRIRDSRKGSGSADTAKLSES